MNKKIFLFSTMFLALLLLGAPSVFKGRFLTDFNKTEEIDLSRYEELSHKSAEEWDLQLGQKLIDYKIIEVKNIENLTRRNNIIKYLLTKTELSQDQEYLLKDQKVKLKNKDKIGSYIKFKLVTEDSYDVLYGYKLNNQQEKLHTFFNPLKQSGKISAKDRISLPITVKVSKEGNAIKVIKNKKVLDMPSTLLMLKLDQAKEAKLYHLELQVNGLAISGDILSKLSAIEQVSEEDSSSLDNTNFIARASSYSSGGYCCPEGGVGDYSICMSCPETCYPCGSSAECGDGNLDEGEGCDDGNTSDGDGCSSGCQSEVKECGNMVVEQGEQCDDGNRENGDGCNQECYTEQAYCGNNRVEEGEACDLGDLNDGKNCTSNCMIPKCGDGEVQEDRKEECDDGNTDKGDGCDGACKIECDFTFNEETKAVEELEYLLSFKPAGDEELCKISSITITEEKPKLEPTRNYIGSIEGFDWTYYVSEDTNEAYAISSSHKWYGSGDGSDSCIELIAPANQAGTYKANVNVSFSNGSETEKEIELDVDIQPENVPNVRIKSAAHGFTIINDKDEFGGSRKECCAGVDCPKLDCLSLELHNDIKARGYGQYNQVADREEVQHVKQFQGSVPWVEGGFTDKTNRPVFTTEQFILAYGEGSAKHKLGPLYVCKTLKDKDQACLEAEAEVENNLYNALEHFINSTGSHLDETRCFSEKAAKETIGLTREKAGVDYKCAYVETGSCPLDPKGKPYTFINGN